MLINSLFIAHILIIGYWLGSELVINNTYRYVSWSAGMPFNERDRLMDHVMEVDQHVRYALILQLGSGMLIASLLGYLPIHRLLSAGIVGVTAAWIFLAEAAHRSRKTPGGRLLTNLDRYLRILVILVLVGVCGSVFAGMAKLPTWLTIKLLLFAGVIACGLGIRWALIRFYARWKLIENEGSTEAHEAEIRKIYTVATSILVMLWLLIGSILILSIAKP